MRVRYLKRKTIIMATAVVQLRLRFMMSEQAVDYGLLWPSSLTSCEAWPVPWRALPAIRSAWPRGGDLPYGDKGPEARVDDARDAQPCAYPLRRVGGAREVEAPAPNRSWAQSDAGGPLHVMGVAWRRCFWWCRQGGGEAGSRGREEGRTRESVCGTRGRRPRRHVEACLVPASCRFRTLTTVRFRSPLVVRGQAFVLQSGPALRPAAVY